MATPREILENAFAGTAEGDGRAFVAMLAPDIRWTVTGTTAWSRTYEGLESVIGDLLRPLSKRLGGRNLVMAHRFIEAGDMVVVEGANHSVAVTGEPYPNQYCWLFRFRGEQVIEIVEYCDTALIDRVLGVPGESA